MNMKKILYVFLLLTAFSFIQPTTVMAAAGSDQPESPPLQEVCSAHKLQNECASASGCYWVENETPPYLGNCQPCPANHYCTSNSADPIKCKAPKSSAPEGSDGEEDCTYYCSTLSDRWFCQGADGCYWDLNSNTCKICPENNYCEPYTQPVACPDGVAPEGSNSPDDCKKDCSVATNKTICRNDYPGCYWDETSGECTLCPKGYYCDSTSPYKHGCPDGYTSESGADAENDCKIICERYANNSDWCKTAAGCYYDSQKDECKTCTAGYYCVSGKNNRIECPKDATSSAGAKSITDCYFSVITIKETNSKTNTSKGIEVKGELHFFVPGNNYQIVQQPFESLDFCLPDFACD